jgi:hypothetical protein
VGGWADDVEEEIRYEAEELGSPVVELGSPVVELGTPDCEEGGADRGVDADEGVEVDEGASRSDAESSMDNSERIPSPGTIAWGEASIDSMADVGSEMDLTEWQRTSPGTTPESELGPPVTPEPGGQRTFMTLGGILEPGTPSSSSSSSGTEQPAHQNAEGEEDDRSAASTSTEDIAPEPSSREASGETATLARSSSALALAALEVLSALPPRRR